MKIMAAMNYFTRVVKQHNSLITTVPKEVCTYLGLKKRNHLSWYISEGIAAVWVTKTKMKVEEDVRTNGSSIKQTRP
jgi:hypothetical protein